MQQLLLFSADVLRASERAAKIELIDEKGEERDFALVHFSIRKKHFSWYQPTKKTLKENQYCLQQSFKHVSI